MSRAREPVRSSLSSLSVAVRSIALGLIAGLAGCGDDGPATDADASPQCAEATLHADLDWIQTNVFTPSCSNFTSCHKGAATQAGGLNLEVDRAHDAMVNVPSTGFPTWKLVIPGDAANSYLMVAVGQYPGPLDPRVGTMPYNSRLLCREKRDAIERWIAAGAPATASVAGATPP